MTNDIKRAYFDAAAKREIYIEIPHEDKEPGDEWRVGRLNLSLYGTRDAAQNWSETVSQCLLAIGFKKGLSSACNFYHKVRNMSSTVDGDGFTSTGIDGNWRWLQQELEKKFEVKSKDLTSMMKKRSEYSTE